MNTKRSKGLRERIAARQTNAPEQQSLTAEDHHNVETFTAKLEEAILILKDEVADISAGKIQAVSQRYEQKSQLLKWLELRMPLVEPFLQNPLVREFDIPAKLATLRDVAAQDSELLTRMATAARTIVREIEKASTRNELTGLYGKSGKRLAKEGSGRVSLNRSL
ncbi:MAG: flagellar biosynthesis protein FlgI [Shimia sp.]|nr:flagellar biosynthesis protein FlgI [Shimia sp.]